MSTPMMALALIPMALSTISWMAFLVSSGPSSDDVADAGENVTEDVRTHDACSGDDPVISGDLLVLQCVCGSDNHCCADLFLCEVADDVQDDLGGFLHALDGHVFVFAVEVEAAGEDVGAGQAHE